MVDYGKWECTIIYDGSGNIQVATTYTKVGIGIVS